MIFTDSRGFGICRRHRAEGGERCLGGTGGTLLFTGWGVILNVLVVMRGISGFAELRYVYVDVGVCFGTVGGEGGIRMVSGIYV